MSAPIGHNSGAMANPGNYVRISRDIESHPVVAFGQPVRPVDPSRGSYSRAEAWLHLVFKARWKSGEESNKGKMITIGRGELIAARAHLARTWNWSEDTVRWFLNRLETELMIAKKHPQQTPTEHPAKPPVRVNMTNVISICNYSVYQTALEIFHQMTSPPPFPDYPPEPPHLNKERKNNITAVSAEEQPKYHEIMPRLEEAAGACLANKATAPGLMLLTDLRRWVEGGCSVEDDILPGIRSVALKKRPGSIWNWGFFERAILDLRDRRLQPVPPPSTLLPRVAVVSDLLREEPDWARKKRENQERLNAAKAKVSNGKWGQS